MTEAEHPLREKLIALPAKPGVYLMKDAKGKIIYVGKAARLASRVRSYFGSPEQLDPKTRLLVSKIADFDYVIAPSEKDALLLESQLVKEYRPRYNVRLKDDKRFPYLRLRISEAFPRIDVVREAADDGDDYFGPYTDAKAMRLTLKTLTSILPIRTCSLALPGETVPRPCLDYYIQRCGAPCVGYVGEEEYGELVTRARLLLQGRGGTLIEELKSRMEEHAAELRFEEAGKLRDQVDAIGKVVAHHEKVLSPGQDADVFALEREAKDACGVVLKIRDGKLLRSEHYFFRGTADEEESGFFERFCSEIFSRNQSLGRELLLMRPLMDAAEWENVLSERRGASVRLRLPKRGEKARLIEMARTNARFKLREHRAKSDLRRGLPDADDPGVLDLKERLSLPVAPHSIECFDMSQFQGTQRVGSLVYFADAKPLKGRYRRFKIRDDDAIDDFSMMKECVERYYSRLRDEDKLPADLVVVDGGAGQLGVAVKTLRRYGFLETAVIGLAKKEEEVYVPGQAETVLLPRRSPGLKLLQRVRDEAHRFAITYHRGLRKRETLRSILDEIPGIGVKKRRLLLSHFGSADGVAQASASELGGVRGISERDAGRILEFFLARPKAS